MDSAIEARERTTYKVEFEEIEVFVLNIITGKENIETLIKNETVIKLYDKNLANAEKWNVITIDEATYGDDWYLLNEGTEIAGYGELQYSWIINYETEDIIYLEEDKYKNLNWKNYGIVTNNLLLNLDVSFIDESKDIEEQLGDKITLHYFDDDEDSEVASGLTSSAFYFDGIDDYITIEDDSDYTNLNTLKNNGFTFEFYGKIYDGTGYTDTTDSDSANWVQKDDSYDFTSVFYAGGLFGLWNGNESTQARLRFNWFMTADNTKNNINTTGSTPVDWSKNAILEWNAGNGSFVSNYNSGNKDIFFSTFSRAKTSPWNQFMADGTSGTFNGSNEFYCVVTLNVGDDYITQGELGTLNDDGTMNVEESYDSTYWGNHIGEYYYPVTLYLWVDSDGDGVLEETIISGNYNVESWDFFCDKYNDLDTFCVGKCSNIKNGYWFFSQMEVYALRLYSTGLTEEEVESNYAHTVNYLNDYIFNE